MVIVLVMIMSNLLIIYTGFVIKNKYTQLSSNRAINIGVNSEITMGFLISYFAIISGSFSVDSVLKIKENFYIFTIMVPMSVVLFLVVLMDVGKAPFDLVEAETELIMGFFVDYSGFLFIIFLLGEYLHLFLMAYILQIFVF